MIYAYLGAMFFLHTVVRPPPALPTTLTVLQYVVCLRTLLLSTPSQKPKHPLPLFFRHMHIEYFRGKIWKLSPSLPLFEQLPPSGRKEKSSLFLICRRIHPLCRDSKGDFSGFIVAQKAGGRGREDMKSGWHFRKFGVQYSSKVEWRRRRGT